MIALDENNSHLHSFHPAEEMSIAGVDAWVDQCAGGTVPASPASSPASTSSSLSIVSGALLARRKALKSRTMQERGRRHRTQKEAEKPCPPPQRPVSLRQGQSREEPYLLQCPKCPLFLTMHRLTLPRSV